MTELQKISFVNAVLTEATCGEACWNAREEICHCSCGGKNHGCMKTADGVQPIRTAKIDGYRYELKAVGEYHELFKSARAMTEAEGIDYVYACTSKDFAGCSARLKSATDSQIASWPELTSFRDTASWEDDKGKKHYLNKPYLLWSRIK